jgi:hypothetical protein
MRESDVVDGGRDAKEGTSGIEPCGLRKDRRDEARVEVGSQDHTAGLDALFICAMKARTKRMLQ